MAGGIFINYRRGDDAGHTGRLFDRLQEAFKPEQLFMDVDSIAPGLDFVRVLEEQVGKCDVILAIIGKGWLDVRDETGARRLDNPNDFVRIEIESALNQGKRVIPVLIGDAQMPREKDLPETIKLLARRHAVRLTHERFRADAQGIIKAVEQALHDSEALRRAEVEAARQARAVEQRRRQQEAARQRAELRREAQDKSLPIQDQAHPNPVAELNLQQLSAAMPAAEAKDQAWRPSRRTLIIGGSVVGVGALGGLAAITTLRTDAPTRLMRTLTGHTDVIWSVAIASDGRRALSASWDLTLRLWDLLSGQGSGTLTGHTAMVNSVAFAPDGRTALSGSHDGTLRLWELSYPYKMIRSFSPGYPEAFMSVAFVPSGGTAVSAGQQSNDVLLWNVATGTIVRKFTGHGGSNAVAITPDGKKALSGGGYQYGPPSAHNFDLRLWDLEGGGMVRALSGHTKDVRCVAIAPDGRTACSGSQDETLRFWNLSNGTAIRTITAHSEGVRSAVFAPDGRTIVSAGNDKAVKLWDAASGRLIYTLEGHTESVGSVAIAPDGRTALSGSADKTLKLWDIS